MYIRIQWGFVNVGADDNSNVSLPISYSTKVFIVTTATDQIYTMFNGESGGFGQYELWTNEQIKLFNWYLTSNPVAVEANIDTMYITIGY